MSFVEFLEPGGLPVHTIVHVGAHLAEELDPYLSLNPTQILWIEGDPDLFRRLEARLQAAGTPGRCRILRHNALVSDRDGDLVAFYRYTNDGHSSSIYRSTPLLRGNFGGQVRETGEVVILPTHRLDSIFRSLGLVPEGLSVLVLDIQGAELLALGGLGDFISRFQLIEVEASAEALYEGAPLFGDVDRFLRAAGFERISEVPWHGNVLYRRGPAAQPAAPSPQDIRRAIQQRADLASLMRFSGKSRAQLGQDVFVLSECGFRRDGFFVEFGGSDGVSLSNTYLLEQDFGWRGIVAEPARCWHEALRRNRSCIIEEKCVWKSSGDRLAFNETSTPELSTIASFEDGDMHTEARKSGRRYEVETISLNDLLEAHAAPRFIDYLSIDTEGSEFEILAAFDFDRYRVGVITCEHNYTAARERIHDLLASRGYLRKYPDLSQWDDWYVPASR